ncbi:hypothetical protein [Paenibacillus bovis]|nr:hypothetical protein [Paenibacillus bovis]
MQMIQDKLHCRQWWFGHFHQDAELSGRQCLLYHSMVLLSEN